MAFDYLRQTVFFFRQHLLTLAAIQLPFLILLALGQSLLLDGIEADDGSAQIRVGLASALDLALLPFYWGATIFYLQSVIDNSPLKPSNAVLLSLRCWGRLLVTYVLNALAVALGLMLLILPGVYFGVRLAFSDYICVLEDKRPVAALRQSWDTSSDYFWVLLQGLAFLMGLLLLGKLAVSRLFDGSELLLNAALVGLDFLSVLITIYGFRIYCVMRSEQA